MKEIKGGPRWGRLRFARRDFSRSLEGKSNAREVSLISAATFSPEPRVEQEGVRRERVVLVKDAACACHGPVRNVLGPAGSPALARVGQAVAPVFFSQKNEKQRRTKEENKKRLEKKYNRQDHCLSHVTCGEGLLELPPNTFLLRPPVHSYLFPFYIPGGRVGEQ
jgi:hypothetical protein